ncbi:DNA (cytosine-5)-methyltransferase 1 [Bradyrhizobium yuanmingense]|uniref:DNA mismatch endonuclease Vsr n=1 Tax=Bradyrhizobium yuanmingense TaxID=108015 RepID=UPI0035163768
MTDTLTSEQRSARMALIRSQDTKPEMIVRRILHGLGYRYRLHARDLPGRPDIYIRSRKTAIFVHGCFWHNHERCSIGHVPKSRSTYWETKFSANRERDQRNNKALVDAGWKVTTIWECELKDQERLARKLESFLGETNYSKNAQHLAPLQRTPNGPQENHRFVDVFAGCGGLSLGLLRSGWKGLFAIEKDPMAFATIIENLTGKREGIRFDWPAWLAQQPLSIEDVLKRHPRELAKLRGKVDLLAGGPPCQGFSSAGRRIRRDPRNRLFRRYLDFVKTIKPKIVLIENVPGITFDFISDQPGRSPQNFATEFERLLSEQYHVYSSFVSAPDFGIPQVRRRFIMIGLSKSHFGDFGKVANPFERLAAYLPSFRQKRGIKQNVGSGSAISDLEIAKSGLKPSPDSLGFDAIVGSRPLTSYQRLMKDGHVGPIPDTRLARHTPEIMKRFGQIIKACKKAERLHVQLSADMRRKFGLKKKATRVIDPARSSPTITSMPDDLIHYHEPRTLTVRENARLQSFPDWFAFQGKYTTGGKRRRHEVPRFTQVANAVPPLLAEAIGEVLLDLMNDRDQ